MNGIVLRYETAAIRGTMTIIHRVKNSFDFQEIRRKGRNHRTKVRKSLGNRKTFIYFF